MTITAPRFPQPIRRAISPSHAPATSLPPKGSGERFEPHSLVTL
jgi:hypothetical protein